MTKQEFAHAVAERSIQEFGFCVVFYFDDPAIGEVEYEIFGHPSWRVILEGESK